MTNTHYFLAVKISTETKQGLATVCEELKQQWPFHKWVHPMDYHITLAFLGFAPEEKLQLVKSYTQQSIIEEKSFPLHMTKIGTFGRSDSPRILWVDVNKEEKLYTLRDKVYHACLEAGFQLETRPFTPHITIARKWVGDNSFNIDNGERFESKLENLSFSVDEVVLYKTNLTQTPKYEAIATVPLIKE